MHGSRCARWVLVASVATGTAGCSKAPETPPPASDAGAEKPASEYVTVTHLLVAFTSPRKKDVKRTKEQAKRMADSLMVDLANGRRLEDLVALFSDDRDPKTGVVNSLDTRTRQPTGVPGQYVFARGDGMAKPFEDAAFSTPVGKVRPTPVETEFGFHILRRDR